MSSRPIWKGHISFGLISIPVSLYSAEQRSDVHFKLLDSRNHAHIRYERVNELTGEEVPWQEIVKAFEYDNGNYVILDEKELKKAEIENSQDIALMDFIDKKSLDSIYFEKPYYLVPNKSGEKGYVLLKEILKRTNKIGIAKVTIRSRQYLAALMPYATGLMLNLMRFAQEIRPIEEYEFPDEDLKKYKITAKEIDMAEQLVNSMTSKWNPKQYHDEYRDMLMKWIEKKAHGGKAVTAPSAEQPEPPKGGKVIDFMSLLKKSIDEKSKTKTNTHRTQKPASKKRKAS